jgi:hypothetical protein
MLTHAPHLLARGKLRIICAITIVAALPTVIVAPPGLAQNSESVPAAAEPMKSKPKMPVGGIVTVKVTNWRQADLVEMQVAESGRLTGRKC